MIFKEVFSLHGVSQSVQHFTISEEEAGQRLDNYLLRCLKGVPKSLIYRVIRKGEVRVNKGRAKPEKRLMPGDVVRIPPLRLGEEKPKAAPGAGLIKLLENAILLDHKDFLVINKPAGLAVHGGSGVNLGLIEALRQMWPKQPYLELVHRLDRETSGCILVAKKRSSLRYLQELFRGRKQVRKTYLALVKGQWPSQLRFVDSPLERLETASGDRIVKVRESGKPASTEFRLMERFANTSLIKAEPLTGRTHQIRVHAQYSGHPLVGDEKYGDDDFNKLMKDSGVKRLFLHALKLQFSSPTNEQFEIEAPLSADLEQVLKQLKRE